MKYKVGDVVRVRKDLCWGSEYNNWMVVNSMLEYRGMTVTIARVDFDHYHIKEDGHCAWTDEMFEPAPICTEKIVITSDGVTTTAKKYDGKKIIKEAKAICSKDDVFNFEVGANLAMERLLGGGIPAKSLYNGKVVCVETEYRSLYTKGKIYQFKDGIARDDSRTRFCCCVSKPIASFDELQKRDAGTTWLEVVE